MLHKAVIEVNELGTEAAAATGISIAAMSLDVGPKVVFNADHPFAYVLADGQTVLFVGDYVGIGSACCCDCCNKSKA